MADESVVVTGVSLEVVVHQNWGKKPVQTQQIEISAADKDGTVYSYFFNPLKPDLDLAKDLLTSIGQNRGQVPWKFLAIGKKIVKAV